MILAVNGVAIQHAEELPPPVNGGCRVDEIPVDGIAVPTHQGQFPLNGPGHFRPGPMVFHQSGIRFGIVQHLAVRTDGGDAGVGAPTEILQTQIQIVPQGIEKNFRPHGGQGIELILKIQLHRVAETALEPVVGERTQYGAGEDYQNRVA